MLLAPARAGRPPRASPGHPLYSGGVKLEDLRREYAGAPLDEEAAGDDPLALFERWLDEAVAAQVPFADGMVLATAGPDGQPSARVVLLKRFDARGFVFYSNYDSSKGEQLARNPAAALLFWWPDLHRQVRVEGAALRLGAADSDAYFAKRPRASNLSAMASRQSRVVTSRAALEADVSACTTAWEGRELERPDNWGGYCLSPRSIEFWQGRPDRLHDRLRYLAAAQGWTRERLCP
jgi:pyridoxamine 5'-phosphate oxidase